MSISLQSTEQDRSFTDSRANCSVILGLPVSLDAENKITIISSGRNNIVVVRIPGVYYVYMTSYIKTLT